MNPVSCAEIHKKDKLKRLLRRFDISADRSKGQHFLVDRSYLETVAGQAGRGGVVIEVGAGPGSLTCLLKESFDRTFAIEIDGRFSRLFKNLNPEKSVEFIRADFLSLDYSELGLERDSSASLVGNIPYGITGKILERAVAGRDFFSKAVFTIQREVADRVLADLGTKDCGAITYFIKAYAEVTRIADIPSSAFYPPPEVDSSIVEIVFAPEKRFESRDEVLLSLVRGLFNYRRKTIRKGLMVSPKFSLNREEVDELISRAGIDSRKRPEELALEEFDTLAILLGESGLS